MGVAVHLGIRLDEYDARIRTFVPYYEDMLDEAAAALATCVRADPVVVDLGVGSGALAARCLSAVPGARVVGIDADQGMLDAAAKRLKGSAALVFGDFQTTPLPRCDAIVASLALHHVPTPRRKATLYKRCFAALRPRGLLINADCCVASNRRLAARDRAVWLAHLERTYGAARAARFLAEWAEEDVYLRLEDEIRLLRDAGFTVDVAWRRTSFAVIVATRSGG